MGQKQKSALSHIVFLTVFLFSFHLDGSCSWSEPLSSIRETYSEPEAKIWLERNAKEGLFFRFQRFETVAELKRFIDRLYSLGAVYIGIVFLSDEPSGFRIYLPIRAEERKTIFEMANKELLKSGYRSEDDYDQEELVIWF